MSETIRDDVATVLETVAKDGLPGPRDLDVALDAICCSFSEPTLLLKQIVVAWESLPGGRQQSVRDVERWLAEKMTPAINAIRAHLAAQEDE